MSITLNDHVQQVTKNYPVLGELVWFSIPQKTVAHSIVEKLCNDNNLQGYVPPNTRAPDLFRRACKQAGRRIGGKEDPQRTTYEIKPIDSDTTQITVKLVKEVVNAQTMQGISWARLANISFNRETEQIHAVELPEMDDDGRNVISTLRETFSNENGKINDNHIRRMVHEVIRDCQGTNVRPSGGIYFVPKANTAKLHSLVAVLNGLPTGASGHVLPLVDTTDQRSMLQAAVDSELADEMESGMSKISEILKKGEKITADRFTKLTADLHRTGRKSNSYVELLNDRLSAYDTRRKVATEMISRLTDLVE